MDAGQPEARDEPTYEMSSADVQLPKLRVPAHSSGTFTSHTSFTTYSFKCIQCANLVSS